jgi:DNA-binding NarL/FixJ family response regulator
MLTSGAAPQPREPVETFAPEEPGVGSRIDPSDRIRILCVDDHELLLEGLKARFGQEPDLEVVEVLTSAEHLVEVVERLRPDIVLTDVQMPGTAPIACAAEIHRRYPDTKVIVLTGHLRDHDLTAACRAGVWGFFSKADELRDMIDGLRRAHRGEFVLGPAAAARSRPLKSWPRRASAAATESKLDSLTAREREVLELIGSGLSRTGIAEALKRSAKTIDGHRERIMEKLDIHSSPELVRFAIREGLADV